MPANVNDLRKFARDLRGGGEKVERLARLAVSKTASDIEADAKRAAPVDTGNLRNSIGFEIGQDGLSAVVGPTANYAVHLEFGTSRMAPRPFLNPAADKRLAVFEKALEAIASQALR